ncbi:hypothetical protein VTK73DRAFT_10242 [Phialemonium thermophilum]|uniref:Ankyrin repeat protein n=1 Tax=Phialemonium thermophilum TaxID=223376 RepID=A0ABR3VXV0_9PEZI
MDPRSSAHPQGGGRTGRPSKIKAQPAMVRKLVRLYLNTWWSPNILRKILATSYTEVKTSSATKELHQLLDNDPRQLRPRRGDNEEIDKRILGFFMSPLRWRRKHEPHVASTADNDAAVAGHAFLMPQSYGNYETEFFRSPEAAVAEPAFPVTQSYSSYETGFFQSPTLLPSQFGPGLPEWDYDAEQMTTAGAPSNESYFHPEAQEDPQPVLGPGRPIRRTTALSLLSVSSSSIREWKRRLSDCSSNMARRISAIWRSTISTASDLALPTSNLDERLALSYAQGTLPPGPDAVEAFPEFCYALPGDFVRTFNCADFPGQDHNTGQCWCSIANVVFSGDHDVWMDRSGALSGRAQALLKDPSQATYGDRDCFGNTLLHLVAAMDPQPVTVLDQYYASEPHYDRLLCMLFPCGHLIDGVNTASQTFLHVLNVKWFSAVENRLMPLKQLLGHLRSVAPDLVFEKDVYGRTFFHRAHSLIRDSEVLDSILSSYNPQRTSCRDAFGFNPLANTQLGGAGPFIPPRRGGSLPPQFSQGSGAGSSRRDVEDDWEALVREHGQLIQLIRRAESAPRCEDEKGRNALHCLAHVILSQEDMEAHYETMRTGRRRRKPSKSDRKARDASAATADFPNAKVNRRPTMTRRLEYLEGLLSMDPPVDVNHYDQQGNTVLMAFIMAQPDSADDKKAHTLRTILRRLVEAGARIEARNRRGETALLVAARLGRKIALVTLLGLGANVHARDAEGRGVLQILDVHTFAAKDDMALYARLEACRGLLTGRETGVVQFPTIVQEWSL